MALIVSVAKIVHNGAISSGVLDSDEPDHSCLFTSALLLDLLIHLMGTI